MWQCSFTIICFWQENQVNKFPSPFSCLCTAGHWPPVVPTQLFVKQCDALDDWHRLNCLLFSPAFSFREKNVKVKKEGKLWWKKEWLGRELSKQGLPLKSSTLWNCYSDPGLLVSRILFSTKQRSCILSRRKKLAKLKAWDSSASSAD